MSKGSRRSPAVLTPTVREGRALFKAARELQLALNHAAGADCLVVLDEPMDARIYRARGALCQALYDIRWRAEMKPATPKAQRTIVATPEG